MKKNGRVEEMSKTKGAISRALNQYREQYSRGGRLSDWLTDRAAGALARSRNGLRGLAGAAGVVAFGLPAAALGAWDGRKKKKRLCEILRCPPEEVAMDLNELSQRGSAVKYYGGDLTYSASVSKEWLQNIQLVFGSAHLEALDEMICLRRLKSVWGSVYVSRCTDLRGANLAVIKGDLHGEKLENANGLERLVFVGGDIFYRGRRFSSLEEFRAFADGERRGKTAWES